MTSCRAKSRWSTAAGQGIGRAIAEAFIAEGAIVIATDVDANKLQGLKAKKAIKLDVLSSAAVMELAKAIEAEFGGLDVLANVAGYVHQGTVLDCTDRDWDFSFDLNVKSMHRTIKAFLPAMLAKGGGSIVNMSSGVSSVKGPAQPLRLRRDQGGGDRSDQGGRHRLHHQGHPLQRHLPGHHRIAVARGPRRHAVEADRQTRTSTCGTISSPASR